jgi:ankyrin repeat protein
MDQLQFEAAWTGDLKQLRLALTVDNVNDVDDDGCTALHLAARSGYDECVEFCIEMGANVNARANGGHTPLHFASSNRHANVARVLLDAGAMVDTTNDFGSTPLYWAIRFKRANAAPLLIDRGGRVSNVKLDEEDVPSIPEWITTFVESRSNCRCAAIIIIGIHKYRRTTVTGSNDINVIKLIAKHIWSTRMDGVWVTQL